MLVLILMATCIYEAVRTKRSEKEWYIFIILALAAVISVLFLSPTAKSLFP